jgi:hypothetical protein
MTEAPEKPAEETIDLKDPALAGVLAWLVPGLGHWYQGRRAKALLYFLSIVGIFAYGLYLSSSKEACLDGKGMIGGGRAVYFSWRDGDHRLAYLCQIGAGLPALPAIVQAYRMNNRQPVWLGGFMAPPRLPTSPGGDRDDPNFDQPTPNDLHHRLHHYFELATFYTMVGGLLNVLAVYDACAGPVASLPPPKKKEEEEKGEEEGEEKEEEAKKRDVT